MKDDTTGFFDGDRDLGPLDPAARAEAEAWARLTRVLREDVPGPAPAWMEAAVMAEIASARHGPWSRAGAWLTRPALSLSPLAAGLAAAAVVAALLLVGRRPAAPPPGASRSDAAVVYVQFLLEAPSARTVAVAGDFDGWNGTHQLEDADGDGIWTGSVPLDPGVHQYMFVVDGSDWVTDPRAARWSDDGFGHRNAVLAVAPPGSV